MNANGNISLYVTNQELSMLIRALAFYGKDLAKHASGPTTDTERVLSLICEFSHSTEGKEDED